MVNVQKKMICVLIIGLVIFNGGIMVDEAEAHTHVDVSNPAKNEVVEKQFTEMVITFTSDIQTINQLVLSNTDGVEFAIASIELEPENTITIHLEQAPPSGSYTLSWDVLGDDGHVVTGEIPFEVRLDSELASPTELSPPQDNEGEPDPEDKEQRNWITVLGIAMVLIVAIIFILILKRGKST